MNTGGATHRQHVQLSNPVLLHVRGSGMRYSFTSTMTPPLRYLILCNKQTIMLTQTHLSLFLYAWTYSDSSRTHESQFMNDL
ncbi:hypothetical protein E2C01_071365 [Portunus trituberculatus]|uniref:Uncharacterized protein n=1 Tax=Portunus trituberculatus TaxID=210409 RepID=A0A5B7I4X3_PORTR|nr:hypothetical protein [Portunus trituberculatus]